MDKHECISVIVSTRNRPGQVARCVRSIVAAAGPALGELIVVDQSTMAPADLDAIVGPPESRAFGFRHVVTPTVGVSRSRNIGIAESRCGIIAVTDDDCVVEPDWIAAIARAFGGDPELAAVCGRILPLGDGAPGMVPVSVKLSRQRVVFPRRTDPSRYGSGGNFSARRAALRAVGGYDEDLGPGTRIPAAEDTELLFRLMRAGFRMVFDPALVVYHESWRPSDELLSLNRSYGFGSAVYLTRALVGRGDLVALGILAHRLFFGGIWLFAGGVVLGKPWHRKAAWSRLAGTCHGIWSVISCDRAIGITRDWIGTPDPLRRMRQSRGRNP